MDGSPYGVVTLIFLSGETKVFWFGTKVLLTPTLRTAWLR